MSIFKKTRNDDPLFAVDDDADEKTEHITVTAPRTGRSPRSSEDTGRPTIFDASNITRQSFGQSERISSAEGEDAPVAPGQLPTVTQPVFFPPFPEWSDDFINQETWDVDSTIDYFEDVFAATDFINLKAYNWLKPSEYLSEMPTVVKLSSETVDLITPNAHLCEKSEVMRYMLGEISELFDYSIQNTFIECEGEGTVYVPNYAEDDRKWTPWNHIYSCCKAGVRGERPFHNPKGKYYVRLYFMGAWRRILVDDRIPILPSGQRGLPLTELNELWPLLLTKALLKLCIITWKGDDVKKFSTVSALTGWIFEWVDSINEVNDEDLWTDLENTLPKYTDPKRIPSCYTLLKPSRKKPKYGVPNDTDSFWWMPRPQTAANPDIPPEEEEEEPEAAEFHVTVEEILRDPQQNRFDRGDAEDSLKEVKWVRKALIQEELRRNQPQILITQEPEMDEADQQMEDAAQDDKGLKAVASGDVTKKKKKKGGGAGVEMAEERKSEPRKSIGKKKKKTEAGGKHLESKAGHDKHKDKHDHDDKNDEEDDKTIVLDAKSKVAAKWAFVKDVFTLDAGEIMSKRASKSARRSYISEHELTDLQLTNEIERRYIDRKLREADGEESGSDGKQQYRRFHIPPVREMVLAIQKYSGFDYRSMVKNWENICGKDSPISIFVVLKTFPTPEFGRTASGPKPYVPAFLQHPIQLVEVRDTVLRLPSDRPDTPLWKRFRWKAWAMKKGLIPMEEDRSKETIRMVKARTPFVFKSDWYDFPDLIPYQHPQEYLGEQPEWGGESSKDELHGIMGFPPKPERLSLTNPTVPTLTPAGVVSVSGLENGDASSSKRNSKAPSSKKDGQQTSSIALVPATSPTSDVKTNSKKTMSDSSKNRNKKLENDSLEVLHDTELVGAESQEELGSFKTRMLLNQLSPSSASATVWFSCNDIAQNLNKFCKLYTSQSIFGSCFILRREPETPYALDTIFKDLQRTEVPMFPDPLVEYKIKQDCFNIGAEFSKGKSYHVTDYHLDQKEDFHSAFYLFSDCWTEQELMISVTVLQESVMQIYEAATTAPLPEEVPGPPPTAHYPNSPDPFQGHKHKHHDLPLFVVLEPWDWRQDTGISEPVLCTHTNDSSISHVNLPPGRNTFRVWVLYHLPHHHHRVSEKNLDNPHSGEDYLLENGNFVTRMMKNKNTIPFSMRIVSQTPIHVGSRDEVQNYMTNPPTLLLKQSERVANNIWGILTCFGEKKTVYSETLRRLRRSYCPAYSEPNLVNKYVRGSHDTFEQLFLSMVASFNGGKCDALIIQALRVLFLNPMLGRNLFPSHRRDSDTLNKTMSFYRQLGKKARTLTTNAAITIQRYYRGWRVRFLFQVRRKTHRKHKIIEHTIRRIAYLLVTETDSLFTLNDQDSPGESMQRLSVAEMSSDPEKVPPTILPNPPHWSFEMLQFLMERHPFLITLHPHAYCEPHHVKIQEIEGKMPQYYKDFTWYPFFREVIVVPPGVISCFLELNLQVYPWIGVYMKIINNDNGLFLKTVNNRHFLGRLFENKYGYTVFCYRWSSPTIQTTLNDRPPCPNWKLRIVTPYDQDGPRLQSKLEFLTQKLSQEEIKTNAGTFSEKSLPEGSLETGRESGGLEIPGENFEEEFPRKLTIRRLTGYYTPNQDSSVCQYVLETYESRTTLSLRFVASVANVKLRVVIWDCLKRGVVHDEIFTSGMVAPCIQLHLVKPRDEYGETLGESGEYSPHEGLASEEDSVTSLKSPLSVTGDAAKIVEVVMNNEKYNAVENSRIASTRQSAEDDDDDGTRRRSSLNDNDDAEDSTKRRSTRTSEGGKQRESGESPKKLLNKRRFIITVYVVEDSWPLTDRELLYVLYRERKFFRNIKSHLCKEQDKRIQLEAERRAAEEAAALAAAEAEAALDAMETEEEEEEEEEEEIPPPPTTVEPVEEKAPKKKTPKEMQSAKKKAKKKETVKDTALTEKGTTKGSKQPVEDVEETAASPAPTTPAYPSAPPPTQASQQNDEVPGDKDTTKDKDAKIRRRLNGNLYMKYGGRQSHNVKRLDQPHWIMEIVTGQVNYKLKSNWQVLRKRLLQANATWESGGVNVVYEELSSRLDFLLENMVEENFQRKSSIHKFSIVDPIHNLYNCLRLDMYNVEGLLNENIVGTIIQIHSQNPEESLKAGEKLFKHRKSSPDAAKDESEIQALLDYMPKNLRKLAEQFQRRLEDRELDRQKAIEQALKDAEGEKETEIGGVEEAAEEHEEDEEEGTSGVRKSKSKPHSLFHKKVGKKEHNDQAELAESNNLKKKMKKITAVAKHLKKGEKRQSAQEKTMSPKTSVAAGAEEDVKIEDTAALELEVGGDAESEVRRIRGCEKIQEIMKRYEAFFEDCDGIREELEQVVKIKKRHSAMSNHSAEVTKLILKKKGISKYTEGREESLMAEDETTEDDSEIHELERKDSKLLKANYVINKLLRWAYDYTFLPPTEEYEGTIEDPGELGILIVRTIMEEQRQKEEEIRRKLEEEEEEEEEDEEEDDEEL